MRIGLIGDLRRIGHTLALQVENVSLRSAGVVHRVDEVALVEVGGRVVEVVDNGGEVCLHGGRDVRLCVGRLVEVLASEAEDWAGANEEREIARVLGLRMGEGGKEKRKQEKAKTKRLHGF